MSGNKIQNPWSVLDYNSDMKKIATNQKGSSKYTEISFQPTDYTKDLFQKLR